MRQHLWAIALSQLASKSFLAPDPIPVFIKGVDRSRALRRDPENPWCLQIKKLFIANPDDSYKAVDLMSKFQISNSQLYRVILDLKSSGIIMKVSSGTYQLVPPPPKKSRKGIHL